MPASPAPGGEGRRSPASRRSPRRARRRGAPCDPPGAVDPVGRLVEPSGGVARGAPAQRDPQGDQEPEREVGALAGVDGDDHNGGSSPIIKQARGGKVERCEIVALHPRSLFRNRAGADQGAADPSHQPARLHRPLGGWAIAARAHPHAIISIRRPYLSNGGTAGIGGPPSRPRFAQRSRARRMRPRCRRPCRPKFSSPYQLRRQSPRLPTSEERTASPLARRGTLRARSWVAHH